MLDSFKPHGQAKTETDAPDRFEWFNIGHDGLTAISSQQALPFTVLSHINTFKSFIAHSQEIAKAIFECLALQLRLPPSAFGDYHAPDKPLWHSLTDD
jgi:hypothetical protein